MPPGAVQKGAPYFVLPSVSEASLASLVTASLLTSFGMALHEETPRLTPRGDEKRGSGGQPIPVFSRRVSAEGPPRFARGDKKEGGLGATAGGLAQKHF